MGAGGREGGRDRGEGGKKRDGGRGAMEGEGEGVKGLSVALRHGALGGLGE